MAVKKAQRAQLVERRTKAIEMRTRSVPWQTIADLLGYNSSHAACQDVSRELARRRDQMGLATEQLRTLELEKLDVLEAEVWTVLKREHVTVSHGRVITVQNSDGEKVTIPDDEWVLKAVDRLVRIGDRRAKLTGLDVPVKVEHTGRIVYEFGPGINPEALR